MSQAQDIYQQYMSSPEMLGETIITERQKADEKKHEDLAKQVAVLTASVERMYSETQRAAEDAAKARRLAWIAIVIALAMSAGAIAESMSMLNAMLH